MTAKAVFAGASSGNGGHWHGIDWAKCHLEVKRLQTRIVKATKEGRWGKAKSLQWLLTPSFSGKALAVRRVTENQGKQTPGVDQVTWSTPDAKYHAIEALIRRGYTPQPLRRISIPKKISAKVNFIRFADDFVITGSSQELLQKEVLPLVEHFMHERSLQLSPEKTKITHIAKGFDFLGQNIRKYNGKLLIKPSKKNVQAFLAKIRTAIKGNPTANQINLIGLLNPMIRGWANYHRHVVSKKVFSTVDFRIWQGLWRWCCRRHPNKRKPWIKNRYFHCIGDRRWVFAAPTDKRRSDGKPIMMTLCRASDIPIRRHTKIKSEANPFDPAWESYFEGRIGQQMFNSIVGRKKLIRLWFDQQGECIVCGQRITKETGWHVHHIVRRIDGGTNSTRNLTMLHPTCHNQIHSQGKTVSKPAPVTGL